MRAPLLKEAPGCPLWGACHGRLHESCLGVRRPNLASRCAPQCVLFPCLRRGVAGGHWEAGSLACQAGRRRATDGVLARRSVSVLWMSGQLGGTGRAMRPQTSPSRLGGSPNLAKFLEERALGAQALRQFVLNVDLGGKLPDMRRQGRWELRSGMGAQGSDLGRYWRLRRRVARKRTLRARGLFETLTANFFV